VCGEIPGAGEELVLARGRQRVVHCSQFCLGETLDRQRVVAARRRRRAIAAASLAAVLLAGGWTVWRHRAPGTRSISLSWLDTGWQKPARPQPIYFGPAWPPTDDDWTFAFQRVRWMYPLPGPMRRAPDGSERILGPEAARGPAAFCRAPDACGVMLGGELWGEHVYAALDGVVERVHGGSGDEHGGVTVRLAHLGGMVFTQYSHLAAIPRGVSRGAHVQAGDVIGLVGDTGMAGEHARRAHLHFSLSVRPSPAFPEVYWDPRPLMAHWPLQVPPHGTVAGLTAPILDEDLLRKRRGR
jgi:murein DD-endopeptidase MepM/ murein hydrolase activator NlpD